MSTAVFAIRILLAGVFVTAGAAKLLDLEGSKRAMREFGVPSGIAPIAGVLLPVAELAAAVLLLPAATAQIGAALALVLLLVFMAGIANAMRHGVAPDCHCFGQLHSAPAGPETLVRNGVLAAGAVVVLAAGPGPEIGSWVSDRSAAEIVAVAAVMALVVLGMSWFHLWTEVRILRRDIGSARRQAAGAPPGLPVGATAPEFALESVDGEMVSLESLRADGVPVMLVFTSPWCGSCAEVFPNLRRWQQSLSERLTIALISAGPVEDNRPIAQEHGLKRLLMQKEGEVGEAYRIRGTPSAVLITPDGKIGTVPAESVFSIEPMVRLVLRGDDGVGVPQASIA